MTPRELMEAFGVLAEAPDGVKRLRELVLQLAVRGKLLPQVEGEEPAGVLLERALEDRSWRVEEREPKLKPDAAIAALGGLVPTPEGWTECRLVEVAQLVNGRAYAQDELLDQGTPVIRIQNLNGGTNWYYSDLTVPDRQYCGEGDLLFAWSASFGPYFWRGARAIYHYHIWKLVLSPALDKRFFFNVLSNLTESVRGQSHGLAMLHMTKSKMEQWPVLLPPLAEQHRIVAKVDELMAFLDKLEAAKTARDATRKALRDAVLAALREADSPDDVDLAWGRIAEQMDELFAEPEDVAPLRQAVLQLAVRGRLVRQVKGDEPVSKLLERIGKAKKRMAVERRVRIEQTELPLGDDEVPFSLPDGWKWCRNEQVCWQITDGTHYTPTYVSHGVPFLSVKDMSGGVLDFTNTRYIAPAEHETLAQRCRPERGDMLLTKVGTTGIAVEVDTDQAFSLFVSVALLKGFPDHILPKYFQHVLNSPVVKRQSAEGTEGIGNKNLVLRKIRSFAIPIAPVEEQHRIVAKVDQLMALLDKLESRLREAKRLQAAFAAAAVHHLHLVGD